MEIACRNALSEDWVIQRLVDLADNADTSASQIRALDLLGRHLRMFGTDNNRGENASYADELESLADEIKAAVDAVPRIHDRQRPI